LKKDKWAELHLQRDRRTATETFHMMQNACDEKIMIHWWGWGTFSEGSQSVEKAELQLIRIVL
jgi:hypothetical protein